MKFNQFENGSCDIEFSLKERWIILKKGKIHLTDKMFKHFGNTLVKMVVDWQIKFDDDVKNLRTNSCTKINGE